MNKGSWETKLVKNKEAWGTFLVCKNLDSEILGIDLINDLGMSYDGRGQQVFLISDAKDTLVTTGETTIGSFSTKVIMARYTGKLTPFAT